MREKLLVPIRDHGMSVQQIFGHIDGDGGGTIDAEEFGKAVRAMQKEDRYMDVDPEKAFAHIDKDGSGSIEVAELTRFLSEGSGSGDGPAYEFIFVCDYRQAGQAYRSSNTRAFEIFDFSTFYTRACRVPHTHQRGPQLPP